MNSLRIICNASLIYVDHFIGSAAQANLFVLGENGVDHVAFQAGDMHFVDADGNGEINNTVDDYYNYISYHKLTEEGYKEGTTVLTYYIYDNTDGEDSIIERYDFVIETP